MKVYHLRFALAERGSADGQIDLVCANRDETTQVPDGGGAYVLGTATTTLIYPWGDSPVFYIGKAAHLRRRLRTHRANARKAARERDAHWHPRHRYAEAFGAHAAWFHARDGETPEEVETALMQAFYRAVGAIPAANTTWPGRRRRGHDDKAKS